MSVKKRVIGDLAAKIFANQHINNNNQPIDPSFAIEQAEVFYNMLSAKGFVVRPDGQDMTESEAIESIQQSAKDLAEKKL
ncbi:hypothetical protein [Pseudoalteromonas nigrifaciens]|uniref:hypothetical protein n=1 Tax=Pseudoalteromonas nigrifaciens TaxID=28109 RepID=UPI003F978247